MLEVFNLNRQKVAILQNAFNITEQIKLNEVNTFNFSLPYNDEKNKYCQPLYYVRYNNGDLYRIIKSDLQKSDTGQINYECEHVIALLLTDTLDNYHIVGNLGVYTSDAINYVLSKQTTRNWVLNECNFRRQFEYAWENETLLSALYSIPNRFVDKYIWTFDTISFPYKLSLKRIDENALPQLYIRDRKNLLSLTKPIDYKNICTQIRPLGAGEGINQLNIKDVNNGLDYVRSPQEYINKYGLIKRTWIDRRYENPESLKEAAQSMLKELQEPYIEYQVDFSQIGETYFDIIELGKIVKIIDTELNEEYKTYIIAIDKTYEDITKSTITLANKAKDVASSIADMADRQRIEMTYSQGATNLYSQNLQGNADKNNGLVVDFYIPSEMRIINKIQCKITMSSFRAYSKATNGGGAITQTTTTAQQGVQSTTTAQQRMQSTTTHQQQLQSTTTSSMQNQTTASANINLTSTQSGGGTTSGSSSTSTTSSGRDKIDIANITLFARPNYMIPVSVALEGTEYEHVHGASAHGHIVNVTPHTHSMNHTHNIPSHAHGISIPSHYHNFTIYGHNHNVIIPSHSHTVTIPSHNHTVTIPEHNHSVTVPNHAHDIAPGIYYFGYPRSFNVYVDKSLKQFINNTDADLDITNFLLNSERKVERGIWHSLEIRPDDLAYISVSLFVQGFIQSRGDMTV